MQITALNGRTGLFFAFIPVMNFLLTDDQFFIDTLVFFM